MKTKTFLFRVAAVVMAFVGSTAIFSGCGEHVHQVSKWNVVKQPTCNTEGERQGTCVDCGDLVVETLAADLSNHVYGEWEVTLPTESEEGKAVKTCTVDPSHDKLEETLPVLSSDKYYKSVKTPETPLADGEMLYTLSHDKGDISFTQSIPARGINTVADAVEVALSFASEIRKTQGVISTNTYNAISKESNSTSSDFYYEFGENYTHIKDDSDGVERWCSVEEDGEFWCARQDNGGALQYDTEDGNEKYMNGHRFILVHSANLGAYYGAENFLSGLFTAALTDANADAVINKPKNKDGVTTYSFSFGFIQEYIISNPNGKPDGLFCQIKVSFTLKDTHQLDTLAVETVDYYNLSEGDYAITTWKLDEQGHAYTVKAEEDSTVTREKIILSQTTKAEAQALGWEVPVNPYSKNPKIATSFKIYSGSKEVTEDYVIENKDAGTSVTLSVKEITPATADLASFDKPTFYLKTENGEVQIDYSTLDSQKVNVVYSSGSKAITIKSRLGGEVTILMKTSLVTKTLKFNFNLIAPTALNASVFEYFDGNYTWNQKNEATVYVGQPLRIKGEVPVGEETSADSSFTVSVVSSNASDAVFEDTNNADIKVFKSDKAGIYTVKLVSKLNSRVSCTVTVTVQPAPEMNSLLSGTYSGSVSYPNRGEVTVTFSSPTQATVSMPDGSSEILTVTVQDGNIVSSHKSGADLGISLFFNEAYDLVFSHPTEYDGYVETVIVFRAQ